MNISKQFKQEGYICIPGILNEKEVRAIRHEYDEIYDQTGLLTIKPTQFLEKKHTAASIFRENVHDVLSELASDNYILYPNFTIRQSLYIPWHTDSSFMPPSLHMIGVPTDLFQCSIYLQDNDSTDGGGISFIPGSHIGDSRARLEGGNFESKEHILHSKAGDLVVWDARIIHRSTGQESNKRGHHVKKLAVQWSISKDESISQAFLNYLYARGDRAIHVADIYTKQRPYAYFQDMRNISFPESFPTSIQKKISSKQIKFKGLQELKQDVSTIKN